MRAIYAFIIVFLVFCVIFTRWYLCEIRGLCAFTESRFSTDKTVAILEILLMLLSAFLIGFAVAWLLRDNSLRQMRVSLAAFVKEKAAHRAQIHQLEKENLAGRKHIADWQQEVQLLTDQRRTSDVLLRESQTLAGTLQDELQVCHRRYENLKEEFDAARDKAVQLDDALQTARAQQVNLTPVPNNAEGSGAEPFQSRFTPSTWQTNDDLTMISGIGPVIQRKLNELGIYSFRQISGFTPEMVDRVSKSIKFFPDRIGRDNWIGQAAALMRRK